MDELTLMAVVGLAGLLIGVIVGYILASTKAKTSFEQTALQSYGNTRILESTATELRNKVAEMKVAAEAKARDYSALQDQLRSEAEQKASAQAELRETRSSLLSLSTVREDLQRESQARIVAETKFTESQTNFENLRRSLEEAEIRMADAFNALSSKALQTNNDAFLQLARSTFETMHAKAEGSLETRQNAIEHLVSPLKEALVRYEYEVRELERTRQTAFGSLEEQLRALTSSNLKLQHETGSLATALRTPQTRGRWGEMTLRRAAELAGMSDHCDFTEQETVVDGDRRQRPDMIVNLPADRRIMVDAKVPLQAFLDALSAPTEEQRTAEFSKHGQLVRTHMNQLASRGYWEQFTNAPEFVVLFLPGESFFAAAVEQDRTLIEDGMEKKVVLATPTTLIALLRAVAYGWRQDAMAKNAEEVSELGRQLHDRIRTFISHFDDMGISLKRAVDRFNDARASLESRVLPAARRFRDLKAAMGDEIPEISAIDEVPASLSAPETAQASSTPAEGGQAARAAGAGSSA